MVMIFNTEIKVFPSLRKSMGAAPFEPGIHCEILLILPEMKNIICVKKQDLL